MRIFNKMWICWPFRFFIAFYTAFQVKYTTGITPSHSVTLIDRDFSYIEYEHWNSTSMVQLSFQFKTYCSPCLLLYMDNKTGRKETDNYLLLALLDGQLNVYIHRKSSSNYLKNTFTLAKDLTDINWHKVEIKISDSGSFIGVDKEKRTLVDDALLLSSPMYFGGINDDASISRAVDRKRINYMQRFVGCIGSVTIELKNTTRKRGITIRSGKTQLGCLDKCREDSCENNGRCLNWFTETACDCIGTGFQGPRCTSAATDVVFLNKSEFVNITLSQWRYPVTFRLRFRTTQADGLLLGTRQGPNGFYITIEDGYLKVSLQPGQVFYLGKGLLHDAQWHFLTVKISKALVDVTLDRRLSETWKGDQHLQLINFPIYIGSIPGYQKQSTSAKIHSFVGCLQDIYVAEIDVVYKMLYTGDSTLSYTNGILKHCPMRQESLEEARKRIFAEKLRKLSTKAPSTQHQNKMIRNAKRADGKPTKQAIQESKSHAKLAAENNKDLIAWITSGVVSGTIVLMIMTACAIHYFKFKYENIFVARMHEQENMQEQQQSLSSMQMFPKQQAVVFLPEKQVTKVVNL